MAQIQRLGGWLAIFVAILPGVASGQASAVRSADRLNGQNASPAHTVARSNDAGESRASVVIPSSRPPLPFSAVDLGPAAATMRLDRMLLLLEPSSAQKQALDAELAAQLDSQSPEYHHWLTPSSFAQSYADPASDVGAVVSWLQGAGFEVAPLPASRGWIEFSGSAGQVELAFQTRVHTVSAAGKPRAALAAPISVPAGLRPLIRGLVSLDAVTGTAALTPPQTVTASPETLASTSSPTGAEAFSPELVAKQLHLDVLHSSGVTGKGATIGVAARSNVAQQDIAAFRAAFGLPVSPLTISLNGPDPGRTEDEAEAVLSASWAGSAAPGAQVEVIPAATTSATDGVDLSLAAIVDGARANVVVVGFAACEASMSEVHQAFYAALYRQAAAQGISIITATGDSGGSACHSPATDSAVTTGYGVNALASTPWNTAVGAAALTTGTSDAGSNPLAGWSPQSQAEPSYAGGGGSSRVYTAPDWQPLPSQQSTETSAHYARLLPDIALPTAIDSDLSHGVAFCLGSAGPASGPDCRMVRSGGSAAAAALMAGVAALAVEQSGPQGNIAPQLYNLSRRDGVFDDIRQGNARLFCAQGSPDCDASGEIGYSAGAGYDLATGLGSVNAQALLREWTRAQATGTGTSTVNLAVSPTVPNTTYNPSAQITFTARVVSTTGGATPTGTVTFLDKTTNTNLSATPSAVDATGVASLTITSGLAQGGNNIVAVYSGDTAYASVSSQPVVVTAEPSTTSLTVLPSTTKPSAGTPFTVTVNLAVGSPPVGTVAPTGKVTLNVDGLPTATASLSTAGGVTTATFSAVTILATGDHPLQAVYAGDTNYTAATSPALTVSLSKGATVTALSATPATLTAGVPETLTATLSPVNVPSGATFSITGSVSFFDGTKLLGSGIINANTASLTNVTLAPAVLHTITAVYTGDASWAASTSNAIALQSVLLPDTVTLSVNITTTGPGQVVSLLATVTPVGIPAADTEQNPTGNVIFYAGNTVLGTVPLTTGLNNTSASTLLTGSLPGGQNVLTAVYVGDLYYAPGTSNPVTINVQDFSIDPASGNPATNLTIAKGSSGSAAFVVKGLGGFNSQIQVVCAVPTQDDMTCAATPQQVTPTSTVTFTVQTYAAGGVTTASHHGLPLWPRAAGGAALAMLAFFLVPFGRRVKVLSERARHLGILVLLLTGLGGVGLGCSSSVTVGQNTGTPLGVATLTITATAYVDNTVVSRNVFLTVNVVPPGSAAAIPHRSTH